MIEVQSQGLLRESGVSHDPFVVLPQPRNEVARVSGPAAHVESRFVGAGVSACQCLFEIEGDSRLKPSGRRGTGASKIVKLGNRLERAEAQLVGKVEEAEPLTDVEPWCTCGSTPRRDDDHAVRGLRAI